GDPRNGGPGSRPRRGAGTAPAGAGANGTAGRDLRPSALLTPAGDRGRDEEVPMKAMIYHGPGRRGWEEIPDPGLVSPGDAIVRVDAVTICGTDLHILKGDVPEVEPGRVLGHEAVGTVMETGPAVRSEERRVGQEARCAAR